MELLLAHVFVLCPGNIGMVPVSSSPFCNLSTISMAVT